MLAFIALFFPSVVSTALYERINNCAMSRRSVLYYYAISNLFINLICLMVKKCLLHTASTSLYAGTDMTPSAALNYMIIAIPMAIIFAFVAATTKKNFKLQKNDENEESKD